MGYCPIILTALLLLSFSWTVFCANDTDQLWIKNGDNDVDFGDRGYVPTKYFLNIL